MIALIVGFALGGLVVGIAVWLSMRHQTAELRNEHNLLVSRVRSFLALMDAGLLEAHHPQARTMLAETRSMVEESQVTHGAPGGSRPVAPEIQHEGDEPDVPSVLSRPHQVVEPDARPSKPEGETTGDE